MEKNAFDGLALLHDLVPYLPVDRLFAILREEPLPERDFGAALFADISGFTTQMEALSAELGPERGAEELNQRINATFSGLIDAASRYHGTVIRFSGDGLTAWFAGEEAALRAAAAALAMQAFARAIMPHYPLLHLKVGVGLGETRRFSPGDPDLGVFDVLAGSAVNQIALAEQLAGPGQIVLSPQAAAALDPAFARDPLPNGFAILRPTIFVPRDPVNRWKPLHWMDYTDRAWQLVEACRPYLPTALYERVSRGHGAFMADLRLVTPLFIRFTGIDYNAPDAGRNLDELVRVAQALIQGLGGFLSEVGVGDKGSEMVALFGAPVALENPALRATYAANALKSELPHVQSLHFGMTCDQLFTGTVGSPLRRAYAAVGDDVNLAARLMSRAEAGKVLADFRASQQAGEFAWRALPPIRVKGKLAPVRVYELEGAALKTRPLWPEGQFVAREQELAALRWALDTRTEGRMRVLLMVGQPGLGKSHLLGEFNDMLQEVGVIGLHSGGRQLERPRPYHAWHNILRGYFGLGNREPLDIWQARVLTRLEQIAPPLVTHAPLLNDLLELDLPENDLTRTLDAAERHTLLVTLVITLLRAWLAEDALALVLDNAQALDALSWDLLGRVTEQLADRPLTILLAMRPIKGRRPAPLARIEHLPTTRELILRPLNENDTGLLAAETLGADALPPGLAGLILQKTGGNPFFIKEVAGVLRASGIVEVVNGQVVLRGDPATVRIPETVQAIVRSRIDQLPPDQQTILKVAAVLGAQFPLQMLHAIQPLRLSETDLRQCLDALDSMDLTWVEGTDGDAMYAFRFAITRELAYGALSFSQRRQLHEAAARWLEIEHREDLAPYYGLLAHHWHAAEVADQERHYATLAGMHAADRFANEDAITFLARALELTPPDALEARFAILLRLDDLYHLDAEWDKQAIILQLLADLVQPLADANRQAQVFVRQARYHESMGEFEVALQMADAALTAARQAMQPDLVALSLVRRGTVLLRLDRVPEALAALEEGPAGQPAVEIRRLTALGEAQSRAGSDAHADATFQAAHTLAIATGNRAAVAQILLAMGDHALTLADATAAVRYYQRAGQIRAALGDSHGTAEVQARLDAISAQA